MSIWPYYNPSNSFNPCLYQIYDQAMKKRGMATKIYWQKFRRVINRVWHIFFQQSMSRGSHYVVGRGSVIVLGNHQDCPASYMVAWVFRIALVYMKPGLTWVPGFTWLCKGESGTCPEQSSGWSPPSMGRKAHSPGKPFKKCPASNIPGRKIVEGAKSRDWFFPLLCKTFNSGGPPSPTKHFVALQLIFRLKFRYVTNPPPKK